MGYRGGMGDGRPTLVLVTWGVGKQSQGGAEQGTEGHLECLEDGCEMGGWSKMRLRKEAEARS